MIIMVNKLKKKNKRLFNIYKYIYNKIIYLDNLKIYLYILNYLFKK
ncbi:ORF-B (apicoplast) [Eimeria tenella]|uniref:ORF-B n=1 Tax=Eimeria tenella TaxID=5802 RepID=O78341_EIMTE|nr:ORF-B [Eimeria tenella]AAO40238.1 ORF-B [Eimeria tenella]CAA73001.1 hypothetical protein [Eimeria tenella]|eukprot:NP_852637.1 ORF-B (apicoplast) [Eimeria tenella strain Penn State]